MCEKIKRILKRKRYEKARKLRQRMNENLINYRKNLLDEDEIRRDKKVVHSSGKALKICDFMKN